MTVTAVVRCYRLGLLWLVSLAVVAAVTSALTGAQTRSVPLDTPRILAGGDIGFRVEALKGDSLVGTLVVRVDGRWVEADSSPTLRRLK